MNSKHKIDIFLLINQFGLIHIYETIIAYIQLSVVIYIQIINIV